MNMLNRGYWVTTILSVVALLLVTNVMLQTNGNAPSGLPVWLYFFGAGVVGLATSVAFVYITQYYTAGSFRPVREIAEASRDRSRHEHHLRHRGRLRDDLRHRDHDRHRPLRQPLARDPGRASSMPTARDVGGIFGTAVATMAMLMTTAYILAMDTFGPITDNAGGIAEFSRAEAGAREITDRLDAVGNTTKALTKGYAIASASLAAFLLFSAYIDKVNLIQTNRGGELLTSVDLANVERLHRGPDRRDARLLLLRRSRSARSARRPRRSSSRSAASSGRCPGSWITPSARTTPGSSTSRPRPPSAR